MALPALAETADLTARGIDTTNTTLVTQMLGAASATVRSAAGRSPILETTSTVTLVGRWCETYLGLPGPPVTDVATVVLDGQPVTDWRLDGHRLWRRAGWGTGHGPTDVQVTYTHGLAEVPDHIVDLVCSLVGAGIAAATDGGYQTHNGVVTERIDDYAVTWAEGAEAVATVMELPARTRLWLASQYGGGVGMVAHR